MIQRLAFVLLATLFASACGTTRVVDTWTQPGLTSADLDAYKKVLVVAITQKDGRRYTAEDAFIKAVHGQRLTPSYEVITFLEMKEPDVARKIVTDAGFDAVVLLRFVSSEKRETYVPPTTYAHPGAFWGYYGYGMSAMYDPGYMRVDNYVQIETSLHDLHNGKLLWTAISETLNPHSVDEIITEVAETAAKQLADQGLRPQP